MAKRRTLAGAAAFFQQLDRALEALPSPEEKERLIEGLGRVRLLIEGLQLGIASIPTTQDVMEHRQAFEDIRRFLERIESDPVLGSLLQTRPPAPRGSRKGKPPAAVSMAPGEVLEGLAQLSLDEARTSLSGEQYALSDLRRMAAGLGIRGASKLSRGDLVHQIVMRMANYRGYQQLSGEREDTS